MVSELLILAIITLLVKPFTDIILIYFQRKHIHVWKKQSNYKHIASRVCAECQYHQYRVRRWNMYIWKMKYELTDEEKKDVGLLK